MGTIAQAHELVTLEFEVPARQQESRVRSLAARNGYRVQKSRRAWSPDQQGEFMLVELMTGIAVLGWRYDASLDEIEEWLRD